MTTILILVVATAHGLHSQHIEMPNVEACARAATYLRSLSTTGFGWIRYEATCIAKGK